MSMERLRKSEASSYPISTTLVKGFSVLECIAEHQPVRASGIIRRLGFSKGNTYHLLAALEHLGYVRKVDEGYELTSRMYAIGNTVPITRHVASIARPIMARIAGEEGIHVYLTVPSKLRMVNLERAQPTSDIQVANDYAMTYELHCTASGKLWLSFLTKSERADLYRRMRLSRRTPSTITDPAQLEQEIARIAEQGYAVELTEHSPYINGVAAPILEPAGSFLASLSVVGPTPILTREAMSRLTPRLIESAGQITHSL